jgi:hypothetical protein
MALITQHSYLLRSMGQRADNPKTRRKQRFTHAFRFLVNYIRDVVRERVSGIGCASLRGRGDLPNSDCINYGSRSEGHAGDQNRRQRPVLNLRPANGQFRLDLSMPDRRQSRRVGLRARTMAGGPERRQSILRGCRRREATSNYRKPRRRFEHETVVRQRCDSLNRFEPRGIRSRGSAALAGLRYAHR